MTYIVIPAYNEEKTLGKVIDGLKDKGYKNIIVVDDGSRDETSKVAESKKVIVLRHVINRGLGAALGTGIEFALKKRAEVIVTFDADGQHDSKDIEKLIRPIITKKADVVIGSRMKNRKKMPFIKRIGNNALNYFTYFLYNIYCSDTQSGLRAFSNKAASKIDIRSNNYEASSEIIKEAGVHRLRLTEVPIETIYTDYSKAKGTNVITGIKIMIRLAIKKIMR